MKDSRKELGYFSGLYFVLAVLTLALIVVNFSIPSIAEELIVEQLQIKELNGMAPTTILAIGYAIEALVYFLFFVWLLNISKGKSKGIVAMIFLAIHWVINFLTLYYKWDISAIIGMVISLYVFQLLYKVRKETEAKA